MDSSLNLTQQSRLQQKLNPRQVLLGRFLEMTAPEIEDEVRRALDENPALEAVSETPQPESDWTEDSGFDETAEQLQRADYGNDDDVPVYRLEASNHSADDVRHEPFAVSDQSSIIDVLTAQLADLVLSDTQRKTAQYIIGNIDDNGYMTRSLTDICDDIAISEGLTVSLAEVREVFAMVRHLDPAGVGAVDLRDCLLLQIDRAEITFTSRIAREIIADWFDLFSKKHFEQLRTHLGIDRSAMSDALEYIRGLNPKPGALIEGNTGDDRMRHIIPDFQVDVDENGRASVSLLNNIPELAIEESFRIDSLPQPAGKREVEAAAFIRRRHDDASLFIDMLRMRAETLLAVMKAIVKIQHRFFETDDRAEIRPMIIRDIAEITGLNISVISRAAAAKYVLTPGGIYPLKMFFNERLKEDNDTSSHQILDALSCIIDGEDKAHPLSDDALCRELASRGFDIARRTVTKYRERLGQPVARLRKQF